mmetsp:Transcript_23057/g.58462  ORF Transcript_23057/g.58462 Transcript_23057/m.58462 type:complete len:206 (-) Transcript_23057:444-1061(-)
MAPRKGVSAEEKRIRMQQIFFERAEVLTLKELEKIAPKEKGIVVQSVKEVLQSLVDDALVESDKIGAGNFFWSLPSKAGQQRNARIEKLKKEIEEKQGQVEEVQKEIEELKRSRNDTEERQERLKEYIELTEKSNTLKRKLESYADRDPDRLKKLKTDVDMLKEGANRWTDNIFTLMSVCKNKFNLDTKDICKTFDIPEDLDYPE